MTPQVLRLQWMDIGRRPLASARPEARRRGTTAHLLIVLGTVALYILLFGPLYGIAGGAVPIGVTFPVLLSAVYFGAVAGALAGLAAFPLNALLVTVLTDTSWTAWAAAGGAAGTGLTILVAYVIGRQRELVQELVRTREERQSLSVERDRLASIVERTDDLAWIADSSGDTLYVNPSARRLLEVAPDADLTTRHVGSFHPAWMHDRLVTEVFPSAARDGHWRGEGTWLTPHGSEIHTSMVVHAHRSPSGDIGSYSAIAHDLSDQRRAADTLRASEERLRMVLSNIPLVVWAADSRGVATFCGGRALETFGANPEDVVGHTFDEIHIAPFLGMREDLRRALAGESPSSRMDVGEITLDTWSAPLRDEQGRVAGAAGVIVDVTERRRIEQELASAQRLEALGRLAGGIAHDFNNHLTIILGFVQLMLAATDEGTRTASDLGEVQHAAQRAAAMVQRLMAFGRRRESASDGTLNLNTVIEGLHPMLEKLIGDVVEIEIALAPDYLPVAGDLSELEQIIMNLALNARDAIVAGGTLTIETAFVTAEKSGLPTIAPGAYALMTVRDTGEGMDSSLTEHVFEPFFTTKAEGGGTGLGLSTVHGIVKQLDGFIRVNSHIGQGSEFHVYLPLTMDDTVPELVAPAPTTEPPAGQGETILLVEDESALRRFAKLALERHGFQVIDTETAKEALAVAEAREQPLSLVLTDVMMPHINGLELAERLKQSRPELPVLFMTGYRSGLLKEVGPDAPPMSVLFKPFTVPELISGVHEALGEQCTKSGND